MRTKQLLTAMALPLFFAACSQEEIVSNENFGDVAGRRTVDNVVLNFDGDAASRMVYNNGYVWEAGDQYGACLMDEINSNYYVPTASWYSKFDLVDYIQTNYPFTKQVTGYWTSEAVMSEGNYFFYSPYNSNEGGKRSPIKLAMPQSVLEAGDKAMSVLNDQLFVGYSKIVADPAKTHDVVDVTMQPILATAGFKMKNVGTTPVTIRKVAFVKKDGFPTYFEVMPATAAFSSADYYNPNTTATQKRNAVLNIVMDGPVKQDKLAVQYVGGRALDSQQSLTTYIMMPIDDNMQDTKLHIYTNLGVGVIDLTKTTEGTTSNYENDITLTSVAYGDIKTVNINFDDATLTKLQTLYISSTDELESLVEWNAGITDNTALQAVLMPNANVELSKKVVDMLNGNNKLTLYINAEQANANVTIPAGVAANAYDKVVWNQPVTITNGTATAGTANDNLKVINKAALTIKSNKLLAGIENKGTITFQATDDHALNFNSKKILNTSEGTINFANANLTKTITVSGIDVVGNFENKGIVNVNAKVTTANRIGIRNVSGTVNINQPFEFAITNQATGSANNPLVQGIVNVNSTWTAVQSTNNGTINVAASGKMIGGTSGYENTSNSIVYGPYPYSTHTSTINVSGTVDNVTNNGNVNIVTTSAIYDPASASTGMVNNTILNRNIVDSDETIYINVSGTTDVTDLKDAVLYSNAELIRLSGTLNIDAVDANNDGKLDDININGNLANLNVVTTGNLDIKGEGKVFMTGKSVATTFNVSSNTTTTIESKSHLSVGTNGTMNVYGTLIIQAGAELSGKNGNVGGTVYASGTWN